MDLSELVKRSRDARGWTREELAYAVGVTPRTIRNIEEGEGTRWGTVLLLSSVLRWGPAERAAILEPPR